MLLFKKSKKKNLKKLLPTLNKNVIKACTVLRKNVAHNVVMTSSIKNRVCEYTNWCRKLALNVKVITLRCTRNRITTSVVRNIDFVHPCRYKLRKLGL